MWKISTPSDLYVWTYEKDFDVDPAAHEVMHMMSSLFSNNDWALCMLHMLGADKLLYARETDEGVHLRSGNAFRHKYKVRVDVVLPSEMFKNINDGFPLDFNWR